MSKRRSEILTEKNMLIFIVVLALVYIALWTLYFLGYFPDADRYQ
jgi:hypothetical protein